MTLGHEACFFFSRGGCDGRLQRLHLIPKQVIKRELGLRRKPEWDRRSEQRTAAGLIVWDERIVVLGCELHHHRLDVSRTVKIERGDLPPSVEQYAEEHGLVWWLDREYGERVPA